MIRQRRLPWVGRDEQPRRRRGSGSRGQNAAGDDRKDFHVFEDCCPGCGYGGSRRPVNELGLERGEKALGHGVVPALPWTAQGLADLRGGEKVAKGSRGELAATVRVEDEAGFGECRSAWLPRHDKLSTHMFVHGETDHATAGEVDDRGQVGPPLPVLLDRRLLRPTRPASVITRATRFRDVRIPSQRSC